MSEYCGFRYCIKCAAWVETIKNHTRESCNQCNFEEHETVWIAISQSHELAEMYAKLQCVSPLEVVRSAALWQQTAADYAKNVDYYRGLLEEIGRLFGPAAYTDDTGMLHDSILIAKVPELVRNFVNRFDQGNYISEHGYQNPLHSQFTPP